MVDEQTASGSVARIRQLILLALLALAVVALIFEFAVARPSALTAWDKVDQLLQDNYSKPGQVDNTSETVQQQIGKPPTRSSTEGKQLIEVYEWRRGIPFLTYSFSVTYDTQEDGRHLLNGAIADSLPSGGIEAT